MKKQHIIIISIIILTIIGLVSFLIYRNYEIKQKEFIFEKNKECLSYKDEMEKQFLEDNNNFLQSEYEIYGIKSTTNYLDYKINKIFYSKYFNSCLFEAEYSLISTVKYLDSSKNTITKSIRINIYNYFSTSEKIKTFFWGCNEIYNNGVFVKIPEDKEYCDKGIKEYQEYKSSSNVINYKFN